MPKKIAILIFILALCMGIGTYSFLQLKQIKEPLTAETILGQKRPDFTLYDLDNNLRHIKEWDGKVIVLNFWGTWCPPCLKEIPDLNAFHHEKQSGDMVLIGIAHDTPAKVREFKQNMQMQYTQLVDPLLAVELSKLYGNVLGTLPYTVVIDKAGLVRYIHNKGTINQEELRQITEPLL